MKARLVQALHQHAREIKALWDSALISAGGSITYALAAINTNGDLWTNITAFLTMLLVLLRLVALALEIVHKRRQRKAQNKQRIDCESEQG